MLALHMGNYQPKTKILHSVQMLSLVGNFRYAMPTQSISLYYFFILTKYLVKWENFKKYLISLNQIGGLQDCACEHE